MCLNDKHINEFRDAKFFEHVFPLKRSLSVLRPSRNMHDLENLKVVSETHELDASSIGYDLEPRRSKRQRTEKSFGPDFLSTFIVEMCDEINCNFTSLFLIDEDAKTYQKALSSIESNTWKEAIKSELDSLTMNQT